MEYIAQGAAPASVGNPLLNIGIFAVFVVVTLVVVFRASRTTSTASDYYAAGRSFTGTAERRGHLWRLPVRRVLPGHRRRDRRHRLRRLPVLDRLPGRLAGRPAAGRGTATEHRQVHDGRRAELPDASAPGPRGRRHVDAGGVVLLPARPDGRRRRADRAAAEDPQYEHARPGCGDRGRRHPDDHLRARGRDAGHHMGADHQGGPAADRRRADDALGARPLRLQPVGPAGPGGHREPGSRDRRCPAQAAGREAARPGPAVRGDRNRQDRLHLAVAGPGAGHGRPAAHPHALLHGAVGQGGSALRRVGHLADRHLLPVHARAGLRRRGAGARRRDDDRQRARPDELRRAAAGLPARRRDPAGLHLRGRVRHDPGRRGRPDDHGVGVVRPRRLRQRDQAVARRRRTPRCGWPGSRRS